MRILFYLNCCLSTIFALFLFFVLTNVFFLPSNQFLLEIPSEKIKPVDKEWFASEQSLSSFLSGPLKLKAEPYPLTLPDLKKEILYHGKNLRPDLDLQKTFFLVGLNGNDHVVTIEDKGPLYLVYQPASTQGPLEENNIEHTSQGHYTFSPHNHKTPLWIELEETKNGNSVSVTVSLVDENNHLISGSEELSYFTLHNRAIQNKPSFPSWEIGKHRVDTTLLIRQKARLIGEDLFLEIHGGEPYAHLKGSHRIDFLIGETAYNCFIKENDFLIWGSDERWHQVACGEETTEKPLLVIDRIDEKSLQATLWNETGSQKIALTLMRLKDPYGLPNLNSDFHFIQAKTWAQFIVECRGEKMTLKPNDWLLLTETGWILLDTIQLIDDYVEQRLSGPLFVIGKLQKQRGQQILNGHLFNTTRSDVTLIQLEQKKVATTDLSAAGSPNVQETIIQRNFYENS